jgi:hypothetical protein
LEYQSKSFDLLIFRKGRLLLVSRLRSKGHLVDSWMTKTVLQVFSNTLMAILLSISWALRSFGTQDALYWS